MATSVYPAAGYVLLHEAGRVNSDSGTVNVGTSVQTCGLTSGSATITSGKQGGKEAFYWDPAVWPGAVAWRLHGVLSVNSVAPTISYTFEVYPLTSPTGSTTTLTFTVGTVVSGSTTTITTPSANTINPIDSGEFTPPSSAGLYVVTWKVNATTIATNSTVAVGALKLLVRAL